MSWDVVGCHVASHMILTLEARQSLTFFWFNAFTTNRWFLDMFHMRIPFSGTVPVKWSRVDS